MPSAQQYARLACLDAPQVFLGPKAVLSDRAGSRAGTYYGPPATWESTDGSRLTGTQVAVAPAAAGNIAYQLVEANPAMGQGKMTGVTYIQRVATRGGVPPGTACAAATLGRNEVVQSGPTTYSGRPGNRAASSHHRVA